MIWEIDNLVDYFNINEEDAECIINAFFELYESWTYNDYIQKEIKVLRANEENEYKDILEDTDIDTIIREDYIIILNYSTALMI